MSREKPPTNKTPSPAENPKNISEKIPENPYDKLYRENKAPFGSEAEEIVKNIINYRRTGSVLELGAGDGRNALYLAEKGFAVTAWDTSQVGLDELDRLAEEKGLDVQTEMRDIKNFNPDDHFDVLVSTYVLHHLSRQDALLLIKEMQERTNTDGLNVITAFTENGDFYRDKPDTEDFYLKREELKNLYTDAGWEVLEPTGYEEVEGKTNEKKPDGSRKVNVAAQLIARKPGNNGQ